MTRIRELAPRTGGSWINTYSGKQFWPLAPTVDSVDIVDIAHSLSRQCRYSGHTEYHYGVGEHSVLVALNIGALGGTKDEQKFGLLHDACEAYLVDLARPVKVQPQFAFYTEVEDNLWCAIVEKFGLPSYDIPEVVLQVDRLMIGLEAADRRIVPRPNPAWKLPEVPPQMNHKPQGLEATRARDWFLETFDNLFGPSGR